MSKPTYPLPGALGWAGVLAVAAGYDTWALKTGHATLSSTLGHYLAHPILGPVLAGAGAALFYHLYIEELLPHGSHRGPTSLTRSRSRTRALTQRPQPARVS